MNDKQMIEEMAKCMADCETTCDECFEQIESVMTMKIKDREQHCQAYMFAKRAVEQGYRKIPEDSVVLTEEKLKEIVKEEYKKALKDKVVLTSEGYDILIAVENERIKEARKETAREIIVCIESVLKNEEPSYTIEIDVIRNLLKELAKQFGVEIKE